MDTGGFEPRGGGEAGRGAQTPVSLESRAGRLVAEWVKSVPERKNVLS